MSLILQQRIQMAAGGTRRSARAEGHDVEVTLSRHGRHARSSAPYQCWSAFALVVLLVIAGCSEKKPADYVAKVGAHEIRTADLQREVERRNNLRRTVPDKAVLLDELIEHEALLQRAKSAGLDKDPQLAREIDNLIIGKMLERELTRQVEAVQITPEEVKAEYEKNLAKYTQPAKARLAILFLEAGAKSSETKRAETRARLAGARAKFLENPEAARRTSPAPGFGALAVECSDDQASRYRGGDLGWIEAGNFSYRWPKAVLEIGCDLENGRCSDIIETPAGFYLVMKTDSRPGSVTPLEKAAPDLRQSVLLKKRRELDEAFRAEARRVAGVAINTNALRALELPAAHRAVATNNKEDAGPPVFPLLNEAPRHN